MKNDTVKLPAGWEWLKIIDICYIGRGRVISKSEILNNSGKYPVYSSQTMNNGIFGYLATYDFDGEFVTWTTDGAYAGTVFYRNGKFNCTNVCGTLKAKNENINMKLLSIILNNYTKPEVFIASGNPKLMNNVMAKIKIPFPLNLSEQKRILEIIETKLTAVEKAKKANDEQLSIIERLFDSYVDKIFNNENWHKVKLDDITIINPSTRGKIPDDNEMYVSFVPMTAVDAKTGTIKNAESKILSEVRKGYTYFENEDILFAKITPCMENGKSAIARNLQNEIGFGSTEFHVIKTKENILAEWLHYYIRRRKYLEDAKNYMTGSVGQQRLPDNYLYDTVIPLPPIEEQKKYVTILNQKREILYDICRKVEEQSAYINALSQSILRKAFNGEL
jgi:restriction endonuclease S subunit